MLHLRGASRGGFSLWGGVVGFGMSSSAPDLPNPDFPRTTRGAEGLPRRAFTIEDVEKMLAAGILDRDEKFELIRGEIVPMNAQLSTHAILKTRIALWLDRHLPKELEAIVEPSVRLQPQRLFEPDIAVVPRAAPTREFLPIERLLLAVEVADASLARDRNIKAPDYALAGLPELWIVDLAGEETLVMTNPRPEGYGAVEALPFHAPLTPRCAPGGGLRIRELLV